MWAPFRVRRIPRVRQHDATDCAAAVLASITRHHGRAVSLSRLRQYASTDQRGTSLLGIIQAATRLGFVAKGVTGPYESLFRIPLPAIAHVVEGTGAHHFVAIYAATRHRIVVMDPADGRVHRIPHDAFRPRWTGALVLLAPGREAAPPGEAPAPALTRFWRLARPHRTVMGEALAGALAYTLLGLSTAIYVQKIVDHVIVDGNRNLLNLMSMAMLALACLQAQVGGMKAVLVLRTGQRIDAALILGYYRHLLHLPQRFFDTMRVGEVISRVNDAVKIRSFINNVSLDLVVNSLVVILSLSLMFVYSGRLALLVAAFLPAYSVVYLVVNRANRRNQRRLMESAAELESQLVESLTGIATIKRLGVEGIAELKTEARLVGLLRPVYRAGTSAILAGSGSELIAKLSTVAALWMGSALVLDQSITPGELMSFYALTGHLAGPTLALITANQAVQDAMIAADRLYEIMDLERESDDGTVELGGDPIDGIRFEGVSYRYGARRLVLDRLELELRRGEITAVVGESGSGKSTLVALLQKVYPIDAGRIVVGELDLRDVSTRSIRRVVGVVPQQVDLFAGSVLENIVLGDLQPDMERVLRVCSLLGLRGFLDSLPHGFLTILGDRGATLSGGERQRLAIARALYRQPEILVLDEATSSLDAVSESHVREALHRLRAEGKTIVLIAHRLSAVIDADRIVVLESGRVVEEGAHRELMRRAGRYRRLWEHQFPGGGWEEAAPRAGEAAGEGGSEVAVRPRPG